MPFFAIIGHDVANSGTQRQATRSEHIARLKQLEADGRLLLAGPTPIEHGETAMSGSIIIADFVDIHAVEAWVEKEPYLQAGVYSHVDIRPFLPTLPETKR